MTTSNNQIEASIYPYEKKGILSDGTTPNPTRLVLRGRNDGESTDSYFPYDIIYKVGEEKQYDILRNKLYKITILKIGKTGYATLDEAAKAEPFNAVIDAVVDVKDPYAHDITTNGRQYLATTNANFVIYPLDNTVRQNIHIATLSYTTDPLWSTGTITLSGKTATGSSVAGFVLSSSNNATGQLEVRKDGSVIYRDLLVNIPADMTTGTIILHIGNLRKELYVTRKIPTPQAGTVIKDYPTLAATPAHTFDDFKVGEINSPSFATEWLKVSANEGNAGTASLQNTATNPNGGIYLHVMPNIVFEGGSRPREASAYVAGDADNLRTKIVVQQQSIDVYSGGKQIFPFSYVGTFHRWNQTGERLIRMDASKSFGAGVNEAWWQASVVSGHEFIVMDTKLSDDSGIKIFNTDGKINAYGQTPVDNPVWDTDAKIEQNTQLSSKLRTVSGTGGNIYFRVGMASKLPSAESAPRYGLIAVTYGPKGQPASGTHFIYVRQGEAADYLMRPWDASTQPIFPAGHARAGQINNLRGFDFPSANRPYAAKFCPYNLTDPRRQSATLTKLVNNGSRNYTFVQYPSQGGYYFNANSVDAIEPHSTLGWNFIFLQRNRASVNWTEDMESCPKGYRRPNDGPVNTAPDITDSEPLVKKLMEQSELRQSLWLYPLKGLQRSDFSNQLRGYIADGFFDRRAIENTVTPIVDDQSGGGTDAIKARGLVAADSFEAAYWGYLLFNPHNYASIFIPFSGEMSPANYTIRARGEFGGFFTSNTGAGEFYIPSINDSYKFGALWKVLMVQCGFSSSDRNSSTAPSGFVFDNYGLSVQASYYSIRCVKDENPSILLPNGGGNSGTIGDPEEGDSLISVRHIYNEDPAYPTLQAQIERDYLRGSGNAEFHNINSLIISGNKALTTDDYIYLNQWTEANENKLRHLILRGKTNQVIPKDAFTSKNWSSITLLEANTLQSGAFAASATGITNLTFGSYDLIDGIDAGAFGFNTQQVQLHLSGREYDVADKNARQWKGYTWKGIKKYR